MSKKNNRSTKARQQKYDIEREKKAADEQKERQLKREKKQAATTNSGKLKVKKKTIKLRKNMKIRGIRVEDSESRKAALELLLQERAQKKMDVDDTEEVAQPKPRSTKVRSRLMKSMKKKRLLKPKPSFSARSAAVSAVVAAPAAEPAAEAMQT